MTVRLTFRAIRFAPALAIAALALSPALPAAAAELEHTSLALPTITLGFLSRWVADDEGLWTKEGLEVKVQVIQGIGSTNAVISGSIDFAYASGPTITRATARGQHLVALATQSHESGEYIILRKSIAEAAHFDPSAPLKERGKILKGHRFAVGGAGAIPDVVLRVVARDAGVPVNDVTISPLPPNEAIAAFKRGAVDGFVSGPPFAQIPLVDGTGVIVSDPTKGEPKEYSPVSSGLVLTRADFCPAHRSICEKFMRGVVAALAFMRDHRTETLAIMKKHFGNYSDAVLEASYESMRAIQPNPPITTAQELENGDRLDFAAGFLKESDLLKDYNAIIDNQYVK
jgi:ABC-type nitrate/sulfonate/bicarbonate transport system substrate-binding protein